MKIQFVAVSEVGASELLPLHPETMRVFLIVKEPRTDGKPRAPASKPTPLPMPREPVRRSPVQGASPAFWASRTTR